ncbi:hypothetical protein PR202_ga07933 [Eleusine coracana subsp. coracana]|uniref:Replication factor C subunit 3 n=1 Tax=Eleusine coracana subsp. coracana TaxID=191504 RepID=A0AAV5C000_ELECO|nr:hypothetical protein PR202_ga07933 [Eleusine coracana subsp. coracana]
MATTKTSAPAHVPSPAASSAPTLSAALAQERRRVHHNQSRLHLFIPACGRPAGAAAWNRSSSPQSQLMAKIHRWGATLIPKSGAAVARELEARRRRTPSPPTPTRPVTPPRQDTPAVTASVPVRKPLRERVELATAASSAARLKTGAGTGAMATVQAPAAGPEEVADGASASAAGAGAGEIIAAAPPITPVAGRGEGTWLKASPKKTVRSSLLLQASEEDSNKSLVGSPALPSSVAVDDKFVWADKYRPSVLNEFICNKGVAAELYQLVVEQHCKHLIFQGPPATGKRSMVLALIRDAFGPDRVKIEEQTKRFELKGEVRKHIDVRVKISGHHVEVNLGDLHGYEKYVITTLLNESMPSQNSVCDHTNCRAIVLHNADKLSSDLQHYIGWFLGRYSGCNRIIFCCSDASNLEAVKHLCKVVTLQPPSFDEVLVHQC